MKTTQSKTVAEAMKALGVAVPKGRGSRFDGLNRGSRKRGEMNKTETAYAAELEILKAAGGIVDYRYEPVGGGLSHSPTGAKSAWYRPDFMILTADGRIIFDDVKGGAVNDAAIVRINCAAEQYPWFTFRTVTKAGKTFKVQER